MKGEDVEGTGLEPNWFEKTSRANNGSGLADMLNQMSLMLGKERGINTDAVRDDVLGLERGTTRNVRRIGICPNVIEVSEAGARKEYALEVSRIIGVGEVFDSMAAHRPRYPAPHWMHDYD